MSPLHMGVLASNVSIPGITSAVRAASGAALSASIVFAIGDVQANKSAAAEDQREANRIRMVLTVSQAMLIKKSAHPQ